ncbi:MAG: Si-specific NAD(P)(+) transhydrogenase [Bacteriovoracia bacterium]
MTQKFDLVVIGSGPGGARAAVQAAKIGKRVALVEAGRPGGSCVHTGTIPSKSLREAALAGLGSELSPALLRMRAVIQGEAKVIKQQLLRNHVEFFHGIASFVDAHTISIGSGSKKTQISGEHFVIATGTRPNRPADFAFRHPGVFDSDGILGIKRRPKRIAVFGAGVIGCEYASIFAQLGSKVYLIDRRKELLRSIDQELVSALQAEFATRGIELQLGAEIISEKKIAKGSTKLKFQVNGKVLPVDAALVCLGRLPNTEKLNLSAAGVTLDAKGNISVDPITYQTAAKHIYAVGDVIGPPALAAASAEQGRLAACRMFGLPCAEFPRSFPTGIYTIPEISCVGSHEGELREKNIPYVVGHAYYRELARGLIMGEENGFVKLLVHRDTKKLLGIHAIGAGATELIHIGQIVFALNASVEFLVANVFNYPTLAEAYKVAALNAMNKLKASS